MIVDLSLSEEQQLIEDSVHALLADRLPVERLRGPENHGGAAERAVWDDLAALGLFGLGLPEALGGLGLGVPEEALAARAFGRLLVSPSLVAQMIAPYLAADSDLRAALIAGKVRAAFANRVDAGAAHLLDAEGCAQLVLFADGARLIAAVDDAAPVDSIDETVSLARAAGNFALVPRAVHADHASLLLAAYLVGIAQATLDMAVTYAGAREQFGQPIGAFQAIKHQCADMAVRAAAAEAQVFYAAITFGQGVDDAAEVAAARLLATGAALTNARANIQIHGGMGFTAECDAHLYLKRAHVVASLGSNRRAEQARLIKGTIA
jgi:alkylation response protein AidB-like acyl-CoA dehydrogenase